MRSVVVELWWADLRSADIGSAATLPLREQERLAEVSDQAERGRRLVGELLLQRALRHARGSAVSEPIEIDRTCAECGAQHGRPVAADGRGPYLSVAHSGLVIAVATCTDAAVGVDVERLPAEDDGSGALAEWVDREARIKAGLPPEGTATADGTCLTITCPYAGYIAGLCVAVNAGGMVIVSSSTPSHESCPELRSG